MPNFLLSRARVGLLTLPSAVHIALTPIRCFTMSATHAHHPPFPQVEASRPSWDSNREVVYSKTHSPDWVPGQGAKTEPADSKNSQSDVHRLDPAELPPGLAYKLIINGVVPRPIAFLSTQDADGHRNLAPYSFFNAVSTDPPVVAISVIGQKNSYCNIAQTKRFVAFLFIASPLFGTYLPLAPPKQHTD